MNEIIPSILSTLILFIPFALLYFFLNLLEKQPHTTSKKWVGLILYVIFSLGFVALIIIGGLLHTAAWMITTNSSIEQLLKVLDVTIPHDDIPSFFHRLGVSFWGPSVIAIIFLIPTVRKGIARLIPIDPFNRIHTITLILSTLILFQLAITFAIGFEILGAIETNVNAWSIIAQLWTQDIMLFLIAWLGVGFLTRRNGKETLQRLGLEKITLKQFLMGLGIAIGLVTVAYTLQILLAPTPFGIDQDVQNYTESLIGPLFTTIPGVLTLGLAAAIGEEAIFRGALQPRFGLILTSLLFALVHSNYGLSLATLIVFGVGLCLGFVRIRWNTTLAMVIHATYNICLGLLSYIQS